MELTFIQTSDAEVYKDLFQVTSKTVIEYCSLKGHSYEAFIGIKRGNQPWHATYNRIVLLHDMMLRGYLGWVCYMDADSFICDLDFDIEKYLEDKEGCAVIVARSGVTPKAYWQVNVGVIIFNLQHVIAQQIIKDWYFRFNNIGIQELNAASWDDVPNDQTILQSILKDRKEITPQIFIDEGAEQAINASEAKFIKQILRVDGRMHERVQQAERAVSYVLQGRDRTEVDLSRPEHSWGDRDTEIITALYRTLLLREPDPDGLQSAIQIYRACGCSVERAVTIILNSPEFTSNSTRFMARYRGKS